MRCPTPPCPGAAPLTRKPALSQARPPPHAAAGGPLCSFCGRRPRDAGGVAPDAAVLCAALQGRDPAGGQGRAAQAVHAAVALPGAWLLPRGSCVRCGPPPFSLFPLSCVPCVCAAAGEGCLPGHLAHGLPRNAQPRQGGRLQPRQTPGGASCAVGTATACRGGGSRRRALPSRAHLHPTQQVTPELYRELDHARGGRGVQAAAAGGAAAGPTGACARVQCVLGIPGMAQVCPLLSIGESPRV